LSSTTPARPVQDDALDEFRAFLAEHDEI